MSKIKKGSSKNIATTVRDNEFLHRSSALGKIAHEAHSTSSLISLENDGDEYFSRDTLNRSCKDTLELVDKPGQLFYRSTTERTTNLSNFGNGCLHDRLGCASRSDAGFRCLVKGSNSSSHKLLGNDGSFSCIKTFPQNTTGSESVDQNPQYHCYLFFFLIYIYSYYLPFTTVCHIPGIEYDNNKLYN